MRIARLWLRKGSEWEQRPLADCVFSLAALGSPMADAAPPSEFAAGPDVSLIPVGSDASPAWALIAASGVHVEINGRAPVAGLRVLHHRDLIRTADGARYFFSSESIAVVEPFPGAGRSVYCGRCRLHMDAGSPAVNCPRCGIWYHQADDLPCWTYSDHCSYCGAITALDACCSWTPED